MVQDVFDIEYEDTLKEMYTTKVWSEIDEVCWETNKNGLCAIQEEIPSDKVILARLKRFYSSRRHEKQTKCDVDKTKKRKMEKKANHRTYVTIILYL